MMPSDFGGETAEAMVGEVTALRSFRITDDGYFLPLTDAGGDEPWPTETSSAKCNRGKSHTAPDPECTCGFYAYGNRAWVEGDGLYAWSHLVLAAVHCSGRLVAGEKGLRGERMRLVACYVSKGIPQEVLALLKEHYSEVEFFTSRKALLAAHPETHLSTYLDAPRSRRLRPSFNLFQVAMCFLAIPFIGFSTLSTLASSDLVTYGNLAAILFTLLVWCPFLIEGWVILKTGVPLDRLESMRRILQVPWSHTSRMSFFLAGPIPRIAMVFVGVALIFVLGRQPLLSLGWPTLVFAVWLAGAAFAFWLDARRALPLSSHFPLVPRTLAVRKLLDSLPADITPSRDSSHRHCMATDDCVIEALDMGGYAIGMIHYGIFSDPEDHPPVMNSAPLHRRAMSALTRDFDMPSGRWVAYIASEDATVRVLSNRGTVSEPVPLPEIDAILPFPSLAWCAPGVRAAYVAMANEDREKIASGPLALPSGYREGRLDDDAFSDPSIANALHIARRFSEQSSFRKFKEIEAELPDGLVPLATPLLPDEKGGTSEAPEAEMTRALAALMASHADPSSAKGLMFAMGELIDALSVSTDDLNDVMSIDPHPMDDVAPKDAEVGMRGGHLLLLGSVGTALAGMLTMLTYDNSKGRVYTILGKQEKSILNASLTVTRMRSEGGGDDDVDALEDAGQ